MKDKNQIYHHQIIDQIWKAKKVNKKTLLLIN